MLHLHTNIFGHVELASQWQVAVSWQQGWLPIYIQWSTSGQLVVIRRVSTEEAGHHYPASNTRLEADPVLLELAEW